VAIVSTRSIETRNPVIAQAARDGCLSTGALHELAGTGIALASTTDPVVVLTPHPPAAGQVPFREPGEPMHVSGHDDASDPVIAVFEGAEHTAIGNRALLYFSNSDRGTLAERAPLALPNGLRLTYGQIIALGGDFYGVPDAPISDGATHADRMVRFTNAYESLAKANGAVAEAGKILAVMQREIDAVRAVINEGKSAASAYAALGGRLSTEWTTITNGRYLALSLTNWDHFGKHAVFAYQAGHAVALQQALTARGAPRSDQPRLFA
jgi:hypothetical protein